MERNFWHIDEICFQESLIPEIRAIIEDSKANLGVDRQSLEKPTIQSRTEIHPRNDMGFSDYMVAFSGLSNSFCVGIVDMVNSTKISASLNEKEWCKYYTVFLNSMSKILQKFGGQTIKNGGDSLLYYFPEYVASSKIGFVSCIESGLAIIESQPLISKTLQQEGLPQLSYRVSLDFGKVVIMKQSNSFSIDLIGPPVNMCAKINHMATSNGMVIGGDLHELVKNMKEYRFKAVTGLSIGLKHTYPIYEVCRKTN
jgi:class 3 adenylate cyclase